MAFKYRQDSSDFGPEGASLNQDCKVYLVHNGTHTLQASYLQESICCFYALIKSPLKPSAFTRVRALADVFSPRLGSFSHQTDSFSLSLRNLGLCAWQWGTPTPIFGLQLMTFSTARTKTVRKVAPPWFPLELTPTGKKKRTVTR